MPGKDKGDPLERGWRAGLLAELMPDPETAPDGGSATTVVASVGEGH